METVTVEWGHHAGEDQVFRFFRRERYECESHYNQGGVLHLRRARNVDSPLWFEEIALPLDSGVTSIFLGEGVTELPPKPEPSIVNVRV
jgi:hypothetical protein